MTMIRLFFISAAVGGLVLIAACAHTDKKERVSLPASHPQTLPQGEVDCSECHTDQIKGILKPYESFSHSEPFVRNHRFYSERDDRLCAVCHARSFCNDCHVNEVEMKPSIKYGYRPDRDFMHRGDYLTRHQIDGKIDPTGCYRCHGRSNNEKCVACHRMP